MRYAAALVLSLLLFSAPAFAGQLEDGIAAFNQRDYATALKLLKPLAGQGNAEAQYQIGYMYLYGQGVPQDYAEAYFWLTVGAGSSGENSKNATITSAGRKQILKHLTPEQVEAVQKRIDDWKAASAAAAPPAPDTTQ